MSNNQTDFLELSNYIDTRFSEASFTVSMFETVHDVDNQVLTHLHDSIILAYKYDIKTYNHTDITLQDVDYFIINKPENQPYLRYCDVIDAIINLEKDGEVKPTRRLFLEDIKLSHESNMSGSTPIYTTCWGS